MRTYFEVEEQQEYRAAQQLLVRRCVAWAEAAGLPADPMIVAAALDSRHHSADGRLAFWTPAHVRRLLLEWIPGQVAADPAEVADAPDSLRTLLRYLAETGMWDPRGASMAENMAAIQQAAAEFPAALDDRERWSVGKFWALTAQENDVNLLDPQAKSQFSEDITAGRVDYDWELLNRLTDARRARPEPERTLPQLPVSLPPAEALAAAAAGSRVVGQLRAFVDWVGTGRALTTAGNLKPADARELVVLLGTGEQTLTVRTSADLPILSLIVAWAKKARLVRTNKARLVPVAKARPLLADAEALWERAFEALFELRDAICPLSWIDDEMSLLYEVYVDVVPDVLNSLYSMPCPMPVARLEESAWLSCQLRFNIDSATPAEQNSLRRNVNRDLAHLFDALAALGAVEITHDVADEMFTVDLDDDFTMPHDSEPPISGEAAKRLREELARPGRLVTLTGLGTRAMRRRLLDEGREVPLVGEMAAAEPAGLLGVLAQHYTPETSALEIAGWLARHGGDIEQLLDAVRGCAFRTRAAAMLDVLAQAGPDGDQLTRRLRTDPVLAPLALSALVEAEVLTETDLSEREQILVLTEAFLRLLEMGGPEAVLAQIEGMPEADPAALLAAMRSCDHPGTATLADFEALLIDPLPATRGQSRRPRPRHLRPVQ